MGRIARVISRVASSAVRGLISGGPLGAILGGVKGAMSKGGVGGLAKIIQKFTGMASGIMKNLGGMGLSGMRQLPIRPGRVQMPFVRPSFGAGVGGAPRPGGNMSNGLNPTESKLLGRFGGLEKQQNALLEKLNNPNLSQAEMAKIQQQLSKIQNMMKQITSIMGQINKTMSSIINNIRA